MSNWNLSEAVRFFANLGCGVNFIGMAVVLTMGVRTRRVGIVLGSWSFWSLILFLSTAAVVFLLKAVTHILGNTEYFDFWLTASTLTTACASLAALIVTGLAVFEVEGMPQSEADRVFEEYRQSVARLREHPYHDAA